MPTAQQRAAYRVLGRCLHCGCRPVVPGRSACPVCREDERQRYWRRRRAGLCVTCGKPVPGQRARCAACQAYMRAARQAWAQRLRPPDGRP